MDRLGEAALAVRLHAHAPYSGFRVGAALEDSSGRIHTGCNVENASYGLTVCAERVAVWKAISEGVAPGSFRKIVIASDALQPAAPCGACRQILWEFCGDIEVTLLNPDGEEERMTLSQLLPRPFDGRTLGETA